MAADVRAVKAEVREVASTRFGAANWELDGRWARDDAGDSVGWWRRSLPGGFSLRAGLFCYEGAGEDFDEGIEDFDEGVDDRDEAGGPDGVAVDASICLSFDPAEQAGVMLGWPGRGVFVGIGELTGGDDEAEEFRFVATIEEARAVAESFIDAIVEHAEAWAEPLASVDALGERLRRNAAESRPWVDFSEVILLGAAERLEEAKAALAAELQEHRSHASASTSVADVTRWLADGGGVPWEHIDWHRPQRPSTLRVGPIVASSWRYTKLRRAAREAVRKGPRDRTREELRSRYEAELAARGITDGQSSAEVFLDSLALSRSEQVQARVEVMRTLGQAGVEMFRQFKGLTDKSRPSESDRSFRAGRFTNLSPGDTPERWQLPAQAAYPAHRETAGRTVGARWFPAELDPAAPAAIDSLVAEPSTVPGSTALAGWLAADPDGGLAVHVGEQRVGRLTGPGADAYGEDVELAATVGLNPVVEVSLTRRRLPPLHLAEVKAP